MRPMILGTLAAFFFASTFIFNRSMELEGGSWIWSASLRYFFMVPFLLLLVYRRKNLRKLFLEIKNNPRAWLLWSFVGFGLFYGPICFSAAYAPGWLIASTWQITIISGSLLAPFFLETVMTQRGPVKIRGRIPMKGLAVSSIILLGILLMQVEQAGSFSLMEVFLGAIPVIIASFAYPLGNRKMMDVCGGRLDVFQRVLGMTIASMPLWIILAIYGMFTVGPPSLGQSVQTGMVAFTSGIIATILFFRATDQVRGNMQKLGNVEATQSISVLFTVIGELLLLGAALPSFISWTGIILVMAGMVLHSYMSHKGDILSRNKLAQNQTEPN